MSRRFLPKEFNDHECTTVCENPYEIMNTSRTVKRSVKGGTLRDLLRNISIAFKRPNELPRLFYDDDGTEIDNDDYFRTVIPFTVFVAAFRGEHWISRRNPLPQTLEAGPNCVVITAAAKQSSTTNAVLNDVRIQLGQSPEMTTQELQKLMKSSEKGLNLIDPYVVNQMKEEIARIMSPVSSENSATLECIDTSDALGSIEETESNNYLYTSAAPVALRTASVEENTPSFDRIDV